MMIKATPSFLQIVISLLISDKLHKASVSTLEFIRATTITNDINEIMRNEVDILESIDYKLLVDDINNRYDTLIRLYRKSYGNEEVHHLISYDILSEMSNFG